MASITLGSPASPPTRRRFEPHCWSEVPTPRPSRRRAIGAAAQPRRMTSTVRWTSRRRSRAIVDVGISVACAGVIEIGHRRDAVAEPGALTMILQSSFHRGGDEAPNERRSETFAHGRGPLRPYAWKSHHCRGARLRHGTAWPLRCCPPPLACLQRGHARKGSTKVQGRELAVKLLQTSRDLGKGAGTLRFLLRRPAWASDQARSKLSAARRRRLQRGLASGYAAFRKAERHTDSGAEQAGIFLG